jgi:hypothetical protein
MIRPIPGVSSADLEMGSSFPKESMRETAFTLDAPHQVSCFAFVVSFLHRGLDLGTQSDGASGFGDAWLPERARAAK